MALSGTHDTNYVSRCSIVGPEIFRGKFPEIYSNLSGNFPTDAIKQLVSSFLK